MPSVGHEIGFAMTRGQRGGGSWGLHSFPVLVLPCCLMAGFSLW